MVTSLAGPLLAGAVSSWRYAGPRSANAAYQGCVSFRLIDHTCRRYKVTIRRKKPKTPSLATQSQKPPHKIPKTDVDIPKFEGAPVKYTAPQPHKTTKPILVYELQSASGLTWTTWVSTLFFTGTAVLTVQNYTAIATAQPVLYYLGMGLSSLWVGVAGYCFWAPLKLVRSISLLPSRSLDPANPDEQLEITFEQVLPFIKYKPISIDADDVGTNYRLAAFRAKLQDDVDTATPAGPLKAYYRHFIKMFSRHTMAYVKIGDEGIWKMNLDPRISRLPSGADALNRTIRPQHFRPWWSLRP